MNKEFLAKAHFLFLGFLLLPAHMWAATLSVSPVSGNFEVGDRVTVRILVQTNVPINAVSGVVSFPSNIFSIESVSKAGSIINFWITEPNFSRGAGLLEFEGVALNGFPGGSGTVATIVLKAVKEGEGSVAFVSGQVLANDGMGSDLTSGRLGATYAVEKGADRPAPTPSIPQDSIQPVIEGPSSVYGLTAPELEVVNLQGVRTIRGLSGYPRSQAVLTLRSEEGVRIFLIGETNESGRVDFAIPDTLKRGTYTASLIIVGEGNQRSPASSEVIVKIGNIISDISNEIRFAIAFLVLTLLYLMVRTWMYLSINKRLKYFVRREADDARKITHKSFGLLSNEVDSIMEQETNKVQKEHIKELKKDLEEAREIIEEEIEEIKSPPLKKEDILEKDE